MLEPTNFRPGIVADADETTTITISPTISPRSQTEEQMEEQMEEERKVLRPTPKHTPKAMPPPWPPWAKGTKRTRPEHAIQDDGLKPNPMIICS